MKRLLTWISCYGAGHLQAQISAFILWPLLSLSVYVHGQSGANSFPGYGNASVGTITPYSPNNFTVNGTVTTNGTISQTGGTVTSTTGFSTYLQTNSSSAAQSVNLAPGLLLYGDRWFDYGIDLGYNPSASHFRTRIFSPMTADVALSYINVTGTIPTTQSQFTDGLVMLGGSGNILIGKTSQTNPSYKLDVAGSVRADKITVNTTGADFVFDPAYTLPGLPELAAYIQANHHLPQMASAADMQKDGMDLGDNQTRLLQKIEELTLYLIQQNIELETLKKQNQKLEEQNRILKTQQERLDRLERLIEQKTKS